MRADGWPSRVAVAKVMAWALGSPFQASSSQRSKTASGSTSVMSSIVASVDRPVQHSAPGSDVVPINPQIGWSKKKSAQMPAAAASRVLGQGGRRAMARSRVRSRRRFKVYLGWLAATVGLILAACFAVNCLVDPLWYLHGNVLTKINYPFNERLAAMIRFLPGLADYDCVIFGTSRASLLPE